jgi:hypothetical protein
MAHKSRKNKKTNIHVQARVISYIIENWNGSRGTESRNCLFKDIMSRKKDFAKMAIDTGTSEITLELNVRKVTDEIYKILYGSYPDGSIMKDKRKPVRWHKEIAETIVEQGLVQ